MIKVKATDRLAPVLKNWDVLAEDPDWREVLVQFFQHRHSDFTPSDKFVLSGRIYNSGGRFQDGSPIHTSTVINVDSVHRTQPGPWQKHKIAKLSGSALIEHQAQQSINFCVTTRKGHRYYISSADFLSGYLSSDLPAAETGLASAQ